VISKLINSNLIYRKLKISDYEEFRKLFYSCFKRNISLEFFKWRYFGNRFSFCYGVFKSSKLIANVGMVSIKLKNKERVYSRHSSMVLKKYRDLGIFSDLLKKVKKKISKKTQLVIMWPNKNNFAKFSIDNKRIINKVYYLYKTTSSKKLISRTKNYNIEELLKFKKFLKNKNSLFDKNFFYFKNRYLSYKKNDYFINRFQIKNFESFFILKRNQDKLNLDYVVLDHFGSEKIKLKHLSNLIEEQNKLIFLSKRKINNPKFKLLNELYFRVGFINKFNLIQKRNFLFKKEIFLGDTDIFISI
jgi:hypothetical protein